MKVKKSFYLNRIPVELRCTWTRLFLAGICVRIVPVHLLRLLHTSTMASGRATPQTVINRHFTRLAASDKVCVSAPDERICPPQTSVSWDLSWNDASMKGRHDHRAA